MPPQEAAAANVSAAHEVDDEDMVSSPRDAAHESQDLLFGASFMIHRRFVDNEWQSCGPKDEGHEPDSGVHRYDRVHGFAVSPDELALLGRNPEVAEAERRARAASKQVSHQETVERWSIFERFLLEFHPEEPYTAFIRACRAQSADPEEPLVADRLRMSAPPALLLLAYIQKLRGEPDSPDRKWATIRAYGQNAITSVLHEFSTPGPWPTKDVRVLRTLKSYESDGETSAEAFDVYETLPKLWTALWSLRGWGHLKRLRAWSMFLVAMCIMARASCLTKFCPLVDNVELPGPHGWDVDGLPKYIIIFMTNWKSRKRANVGKPYPFKIHRNYLDPTYCPVLWLLFYLRASKHVSGPLFQRKGSAISEAEWIRMTNHWFETAGIRTRGWKGVRKPTGCSNHSIRRSAAQWAGRCGAREMDVRNAGRWRSMQILAKYMAQGAVQREEYEDDDGTQRSDPIFEMWVFKKTTSAAVGGLDIM